MSMKAVYLLRSFDRRTTEVANEIPALDWFHVYRAFVRRKDFEGLTPYDLAVQVGVSAETLSGVDWL